MDVQRLLIALESQCITVQSVSSVSATGTRPHGGPNTPSYLKGNKACLRYKEQLYKAV